MGFGYKYTTAFSQKTPHGRSQHFTFHFHYVNSLNHGAVNALKNSYFILL